MSIQALRERLSARAKEIRALVEDNPGAKWNADLQAQYDAGMKEVDDIKAEIGRHQALMDSLSVGNFEASLQNAADRIEHGARKSGDPIKALHAKWLRGGDSALSAQDWQAIRNTMSTTTNSEGGYTVATSVAAAVADALKAFGGMRNVATVIQTAEGNPMSFPTSDGTSETGELIAENTTATGADISFNTKALNVYKYSSKIVAVPFELLQDSSVDIEALVNNRLVQRIGRITNTHFTTGTGSGQPNGVVTAASAGKTGASGQTATVIFEDLIDLVHSVDPAYRALGRCRFMMNDATLKEIRKLKDTAGRPVFIPGYDGLGGAMPDTILGCPVEINQDVATMAAGAKSILFGDFSFYHIRDALQMSMFRFTDSAYAKLGQVGFLMWARSGGNLIDVGGAVKYYQNAAS